MGIDRACSLRATTGSTGHRYHCCSHCPTTEHKAGRWRRSKMRAAGSRPTLLATLVLVTRPNLLPACLQTTPEEKKMRPPHAPTSSHRLRIGCVLGAGFDRRLLALWQVRARRLRPAGRLTCCVPWTAAAQSRSPTRLRLADYTSRSKNRSLLAAKQSKI